MGLGTDWDGQHRPRSEYSRGWVNALQAYNKMAASIVTTAPNREHSSLNEHVSEAQLTIAR